VALSDLVRGLRGRILDSVADGMGVMPLGDVKVIVVPDDNDEAVQQKIPRGILDSLGPDNVIMSNDSLRMYVRKTHWEAMKSSFMLTSK